MPSLTQIRRQHALERRALKARQEVDLAIKVCANPHTATQQARKSGLSPRKVRCLRRIWRKLDVSKPLQWEGVL